MQDLTKLKAEILDEIEAAGTPEALENVRITALGKRGRVTGLLKELGALSAQDKKTFGAALNQMKTEINGALSYKREALETQALNVQLGIEKFDVTLSPEPEVKGSIHPVTQVLEECMSMLREMKRLF